MPVKTLSILFFALFLSSCATFPPPPGQTSKAGYVGDYDAVHLEEIIVAVPTGLQENHYLNLHLSFSVLINPKEVTFKSSCDVRNIVNRFYARMSSTIVLEILNYGRVSIQDLPSLRDVLVNKAQSEFNQVFSKWSNSDTFDVEIVLTALFLTDGTVGRLSKRALH